MAQETDRTRAEKIARAALAVMAERGIPPTPDNYQLWYAYAAGDNAELKSTVDAMLGMSGPADAAAVSVLCARFCTPETAEDAMADIGDRVASELDAIARMLDTAGHDQSAYGRTLSQASGQLKGGNVEAGHVHKVIEQIVGATRAMETRTKVLEQKLQSSSKEVGELRDRLESVRRESLTDPLTGIANRKAFDVEMRRSLEAARAAGEHLCLMMCDIDHFKRFNDTWGHQTGDQVLKLVANCLSENVKGRDTTARYGGEEFVVILPQTSISDALTLAEQIRIKVESKKLVKKSTGDILGTISISCGVAILNPGDNADTLLQRADACLYTAKRTGRNRVVTENHPDYARSVEAAA